MASKKWIDITMPFGHPAGTWPGDMPFHMDWTGQIGGGEWGVNLSRFESSPHNGTHSDAPLHVVPNGAASESLDVDAYLGPCVVVDATKNKSSQLAADIVDAKLLKNEARILFRTRDGPVPPMFPKHFKGLSEALAKKLADAKVRLVGTDAPSMDAFDSKGLHAHKILFGGGCHVLENLDLSQARPGDYELFALPLKVNGLCAAPVRALLKPR